MAYTPKTWNCGDTITAEDLNRMEEGISSASGGTDIIVIRPSNLRRPTVGGVASNLVYYNDCNGGGAQYVSIALWDKFDDYNGQPIILIDGADNYTLVASIDYLQLCASDKTEDASSGNTLALRNDTEVFALLDSSSRTIVNLASPDTEFYKWFLK